MRRERDAGAVDSAAQLLQVKKKTDEDAEAICSMCNGRLSTSQVTHTPDCASNDHDLILSVIDRLIHLSCCYFICVSRFHTIKY